MSDATGEWVRRATQGDDDAVARLLRRYLPSLRTYVKKRLDPVLEARESAGDVVQSCCREVLQHLERFQYDGEDGFRRWLFATALRKIRDHHRHFAARKRDVGREQRESPEQSPLEWLKTLGTPSQGAMQKEARDKVAALLEELSEQDRRVITLAYFDGLSHAEIATDLEITANAARVRLSRALGRLAKLLRREGW